MELVNYSPLYHYVLKVHIFCAVNIFVNVNSESGN
jgi:hypothetical protein